MPDDVEIVGEAPPEVPFHDLAVIEVELQPHVVPADGLDAAAGLAGPGQQVAGRVDAVEWFEEDADVVGCGAVGGEAHVLDEYRQGFAAVGAGDDTRQNMNHRDVQDHCVVQRLFEVAP